MALKQKDLAAHWGVSTVYVCKQVKKGCPLDSKEAADAWRAKHTVASKRGKGKPKPAKARPGADQQPGEGADAPAIAPPAPPPPDLAGTPAPEPSERLDTLKSALAAAIGVQSEAYRLVMETVRASAEDQQWLGVRIAAWNKATEGRLKTEEAVQELETKAGRLLPFEEHTALLARALMPIFSRLFSLGKRVASKANPTNPVLAEKEVTTAIKDAVRDAQNTAFPISWADVEAQQAAIPTEQ